MLSRSGVTQGSRQSLLAVLLTLVVSCAAGPGVAAADQFGPSPASPPTFDQFAVHLVRGDFNQDGKQDLAVVGQSNAGANQGASPGDVTILLGDGAGGFTTAAGSPLSVGSQAGEVVTGDFTGDGVPDLAISTSNGLVILAGDGHGGFSPAAGSPVLGAEGYLAVGRFIEGGAEQVAVSGGGEIQIVGQTPSGFSVLPSSIPNVPNPGPLTAGYFAANGHLALGVADTQDATVYMLTGDGKGTFTVAPGSPVATGIPAQSCTSFCFVALESITSGGFNHDNHLDVAVGSQFGQASVLLGDGNGGLTLAPGSPFAVGNNQAGGQVMSLAAGDFNDDGVDDLASADYAQGGCEEPCTLPNDAVSVLLSDGQGRFSHAPGSPYALGGVTGGIAAADFTGDQVLDIAATDWDCRGYSMTTLLNHGAIGTQNLSNTYAGDGCQIPTPTVTTLPATRLSLTGATLNGTVDQHFTRLTDCHFEYGRSRLTSTAPCTFPNKAGDLSVSASVAGLKPRAGYVFKLVASTAGGDSSGGFQRFQTCSETQLKFHDIDARGCFTLTHPNAYTSDEPVRVNGLDFDPTDGQIAIDTKGETLSTSGKGEIKLGGIVPIQSWSSRKDFHLAGKLTLKTEKAPKFFGFPLSGDLSVAFDAGSADVKGSITLRALGDDVTAALAATADDESGIVGGEFSLEPVDADPKYHELQSCSLNTRPPLGFECASITNERGNTYSGLVAREPRSLRLFGVLPLQGLSFSFNTAEHEWGGSAVLALGDVLPSSLASHLPVVTIGLKIKTDPFQLQEVSFKDEDLGFGIGPLHFNKFSFDFKPQPPLEGSGEVGLSIGRYGSDKEITIDAGGGYKRGEMSGFDVMIHGSLMIRDIGFGGSIEYDGRDGQTKVLIGGSYSRDFGPVAVSVGLSGGIAVDPFHFQLAADGTATAFGVNVGAHGIVSDAGFGVCGEVHVLLFSGQVGVKHFWGQDGWDFDGCDFSGLYTVGAASTSAADEKILSLPAGLGKEEIAVVGATAPPVVTLVGPHGETISTPTLNDRLTFGKTGAAVAVTASKTTYFILQHPSGGRWRLIPATGSAGPVRIERADPMRPLAIKGFVRGKGQSRVLAWRLRAQRGVSVTFLQQGGTLETVATTVRANGQRRFAVAPGPAGRRTIIAVVSVDGFPRERFTVARFSVTAPPAPKVMGLRLRVSRNGVLVSWRRAGRIARYDVEIQTSAARERFRLDGRASHLRVRVPGTLHRVSVQATSTSGSVGRAAVARPPSRRRRPQRRH